MNGEEQSPTVSMNIHGPLVHASAKAWTEEHRPWIGLVLGHDESVGSVTYFLHSEEAYQRTRAALAAALEALDRSAAEIGCWERNA